MFISLIFISNECCVQNSFSNDQQSDAGTKNQSESILKRNNSASETVSIKSVKFFAWRNKKLLKDSKIANNSSIEDEYIQIDQWIDSNNNNVPHPDRLDIVCEIENKGTDDTNFIVKMTYDWIIAPKTQNNYENLNKITDEVAWTKETKINQEMVESLASRASKNIEIKDFNLREFINKYSDSRTDNLWAWKFRVHIYVQNKNGNLITDAQAVLPILPKDIR
jgi:hypothetical protein